MLVGEVGGNTVGGGRGAAMEGDVEVG
eukprot:SAG11_NODE_27932_length_327_cov_0.679825_1_plen_26_part_01